jgi:hypothetical protein
VRGRFSVKEKDEASLSDVFRQDSLDAFILRFAGGEGFFVGSPAFLDGSPPLAA